MKISLDFKQLATKQYTLTARERLMVIALLSVIVLGITVYFSTSEVAVETTPITNEKNQENPPPVIPGKQVTPVTPLEQSNRDPFAQLPEVSNQKSPAGPPSGSGAPILHNNIPNSVPNMIPQNTPGSTSQRALKLTGVVSSAGRSLAVIVSDGKSKAYDINDMIGTYQLKGINGDHVILTNANDKIVLRLGSFAQKEGKANAK